MKDPSRHGLQPGCADPGVQRALVRECAEASAVVRECAEASGVAGECAEADH